MTTQTITLHDHTFHTLTIEQQGAKANLLMIHGYGEHSGRYSHMRERFSQLPLNIYAYDRRGEGRSSGRKGYIHHMSDQVNDLVKMQGQLVKNKLPTYIYAHSLGGLITTLLLIDHPDHNLSGVILSGALLKVDDDLSPFLQKISGLVATVVPTLPTVKVDPALLSRSPDVKPAYEADPLVLHGGTPARTGDQILKTTAYVQKHFSKIAVPILITHGGADKLADPAGSQLMYDRISSLDKSIKIFDGLYHEIMHEPEKDEVIRVMTDWLLERL